VLGEFEVDLILDNYGTHKTPTVHRCCCATPVSTALYADRRLMAPSQNDP